MRAPPYLRLLGSPLISCEGIQPQLSVKQTALLAILAEKAPRQVSRQYLATLLWPASEASSRLHSLSQAIYVIRRRLGKNVIIATQQCIQLGDVDCDLSRFDDLLQNGAHDQAAASVSGEFCEGLVVPGCAELDHWLESARATVRTKAISLLNRQVDRRRREALASALSIELPHPELRDRAAYEPPAYQRQCGFVGRVWERQALEETWSRSKHGEVSTALVTGEPGMGKTTLCLRIVKKSVLQGAGALIASGYQLQRNLPYGVITQLLKGAKSAGMFDTVDPQWRDVLSGLLPSIQPSSAINAQRTPPAPSYRFAGAIHHLLDRAARSQPITIFVDDIQWADSASMAIISYLAHYDVDLPIFILLASRDPSHHDLTDSGWSFDVAVSLQGLALGESRVLVEELASKEDAVDVEALHRLSGGNPFLLQALLTNYHEVDSGLPTNAKHCFRSQLDQIPDSAVAIGAALSAVKEELSTADLGWLAGVEDDEVNDGLSALLASGFVEVDDSRTAFALSHDILGELFLDRLPPVASARLHGRVARFLRDRGSPVEIVATQLTVVGDDPETCDYALRAARASLQLHAHREAEHFFRIALGSAGAASVELDARIALSRIYLRQGKSEDAELILRQFGRKDRLASTELALLEANLLMAQLSGNSPPTFPQEAFRRAVELESQLPPQVATELYADIGANAQHGLHDLLGNAMHAARRTLQTIESTPERIRLDAGISACQTLHAFTEANVDRLDQLTLQSSRWPATLVACLSAGSLVRIAIGRVADAEGGFLKALQVCEQYGFWDQRLRALNNLGVCMLEQGKFAEAEEQFSSVARAGGPDAPKEIPGALNNLLITEYERGNYESVIELGRKHLGEPFLQARLRVGVLGVLGLACLELGRLAQAREYESVILTDTAYGEGLSNDVSYVEIFRARMASLDGNVEGAERRLREKVETFTSRDYYCAARMKVELLRSMASHSPALALGGARELRPRLAAAHAVPLVARLDGIIARCENRVAN